MSLGVSLTGYNLLFTIKIKNEGQIGRIYYQNHQLSYI